MLSNFRTLCTRNARSLIRSAQKPTSLTTSKLIRVDPFEPATTMLLLGAVLSVGLALNSMSGTECESGKYLTSNFVADAIEGVAPSVVNIMCYVDGFIMSGTSSGSGFIISEDGLIVTNAHVVSMATDGKVLVTTMNGKKRTGMVHSLDFPSDIALIKLDSEFSGEKFPTATLGNSGKLRNGDFVVALGSPMQLQNSCSFGIVSATARHASELGYSNNRSEYIQTDAAINKGNSGGPLINLQGHVIGINSMKAQGADGISFAIPMDMASPVISQLRQNGRVIRPFVGLKMVNFVPARSGDNGPPSSATTEPKKSSGGWFGSGSSSKDAEGGKKAKMRPSKEQFYDTQQPQVIVQRVTPGSPAHKCGIQSGDLIVELDGREVTGVRDILEAIGLHVGRTFEFKIMREGQQLTVHLTTEPEHVPAPRQQ